MLTYAEEIAMRNLTTRSTPDICITAEGMSKLRKELAEELRKNEIFQNESEALAADHFSR